MLFSLSSVKNKDLEMRLIISLSHIHLQNVAKNKQTQYTLKENGTRSKTSPLLSKKSVSNSGIRGHKAVLGRRGISYADDFGSGSGSTTAKKRLIMRLLLDSAETATSVCAASMNSFRGRRLLKRRLFKTAPRTCWQTRL